MPNPLQTREVAVGAAIPEAPIGPGAILTPEQQARAKVRQKVKESTDLSPLNALSEAAKSIRKPAAGAFERLVDANIGIERRVDGKRSLSAAEIVRKDVAVKYEKLARELAEKGYDGLSAGDKLEARNFVNGVLSALPEVAAILPAAGADRDAILEGILKDQKLLSKVRLVYAEATAEDKKLDSSRIEESKKQFDEAKAVEDKKKEEKTRTEDELSSVEKELRKFSPTGAKTKELETILKRLPTLQRQLDERQDALERIDDDLESNKAGRRHAVRTGAPTTTFDTEIANLTIEKRKVEKELEKTSVEINKKAQLESEKTDLQTKQRSLTEKMGALKPEFEAAVKTRLAAQAEFAGLKLDRAYLEQAFADSLRDIIPESTVRYLESNVKLADEKRTELLNDEIAKTKDKVEKTLLYQMQVRFTNSDGSLIKGTIRSEYDILKNRAPTMGPKELIRQYLNAEVAAGRITVVERDEKLNDAEWVKAMSPKVAEELLRQYLKIGKLSVAEAEHIMGTEWGKGVIDSALTKNEAIMTELKKLKEKGVIKGSPLEYIKGLKGSALLKILLLLLGAAAAVGIGGPMIAKTLPI